MSSLIISAKVQNVNMCVSEGEKIGSSIVQDTSNFCVKDDKMSQAPLELRTHLEHLQLGHRSHSVKEVLLLFKSNFVYCRLNLRSLTTSLICSSINI